MPPLLKSDYGSLGYYRVAAVSPPLSLGDPLKNAETIFRFAQTAAKQQAKCVVFPELSLTGYTIEDFHHNDELLLQVRLALLHLKEKSKKLDAVLMVGAPFQPYDGRLYNTAFVIARGEILGAIPKIHLPNYKEFYEKRWFASGNYIDLNVEDEALGNFKLASRQLFQLGDMVFGLEICEDFFAAIKPSTYHSIAGANVIFNLSASNDLIQKAEWRRDKVRVHSGDHNLAYVYASSGPMESSKDTVFGGHLLVGENGTILQESRTFCFEGDMIFADIDVRKLLNDRRVNGTQAAQSRPPGYSAPRRIPLQNILPHLGRTFSQTPFVPDHPSEVGSRSKEIFEILSTGLARRLLSTRSDHMVIGLSGGLDSTLALLVCLEAKKKLKHAAPEILGITMPGFGTTKVTKSSAEALAKATGIRFESIPIHDAVEQHFRDIKHDSKVEDITFENSQARERTQILFDRANATDVKGMVVGTGDMSELWLGWCTYNGDQMSGYDVNASVPKTLVKHLVNWYATTAAEFHLREVLETILATPISPELTRPDKSGKIIQKTEDVVGPYLLHDFFLFHHLRNGFGPRKLLALATLTFRKDFEPKTIKKWLTVFFKRGYASQFKRTAIPGGPKVGSVSLSPRGDLRLPDEMMPQWIFDELSQD